MGSNEAAYISHVGSNEAAYVNHVVGNEAAYINHVVGNVGFRKRILYLLYFFILYLYFSVSLLVM